MKKTIAYLHLMRPANIVTAFADILAGFGVAAVPVILHNPEQLLYLISKLLLLLIATAGLYGGGVVFNDVCDADLDRKERPERPIPRGIVSKKQAVTLAMILLLIGIIAAGLVGIVSGFIAITIALLALSYDAYAKHSLWLGPINMALCRAGNLLLGISVIASALEIYWMLAIIVFAFVAAITLISKGEVAGGKRQWLFIALLLYSVTVIGLLVLNASPHFNIIYALPFLILFAYLIFSSLLSAIKKFDPQTIKRAVKIGILSLIVLDATIGAGYVSWWYGILIFILLPFSVFLSKKYAVT